MGGPIINNPVFSPFKASAVLSFVPSFFFAASTTATESAIFRINLVFNRKNVTIERTDITNQGPFGTRVFISFPKIN